MKIKNLLIVSGLSLFVMILMTACSPKKPAAKAEIEEEKEDPTEEEWNINGGDSDQPIMDGWTYEMAAEYYMQSELDFDYGHVLRGERGWLTPDSLARLANGHVQVNIPVQQQDNMPRMGVTYRQPETGGTITFSGGPENLPTIYGDALSSVAQATCFLKDIEYDYQTEPYTAYVQSRGKGLYTLFRMEGTRDEDTNEWVDHSNPVWYPVIISVYPHGDSLVISRGMGALETFLPE